MSRTVLTSGPDRYKLLVTDENVRGGAGNDTLTASVTGRFERVVINGEAGHDRIIITKGAVAKAEEAGLELFSAYGDNFTGHQGNDTLVFFTGGNEHVEVEAHGRGGWDVYELEGQNYQRAINAKGFNTDKDRLFMGDDIDVVGFEADVIRFNPDTKVVTWRFTGLELKDDEGRWIDLHRVSSSVREQEALEDGTSDVLFDLTYKRGGDRTLEDVLEDRLNNGTFGNGVHGDWLNPDSWMV